MTDIPHSKEFWSGVLRRIAKRTGGGGDAEDLLHSAYLRLEQYSATNTVTNPAAFLVRAAVNIGIDGYRHDRRIYNQSFPVPEREDMSPRADEVVAAKELLSRVVSGINRLPDRTREIFLMHRIDKLEYSEIARRLGISESAIEKQMAKAMVMLADYAKAW